MSRFTDLKKKEVHSEIENLYFRHIVVGNDIFTIAKFFQLKKEFGDQVALICDQEIKKETLIPRGPTTLRGSQNIELFKKLYPDTTLNIQDSGPVFFKEKEWRSFKGRMKPEKFTFQEEFFSESGATFELSDVFDFLNESTNFNLLNDSRLKANIKNLYQNSAPFDLVQPAKYGIQLSDGKDIGCEHIYWGLGPDKFVTSFNDPSTLSDNCIQYCEQTQSPSMLIVSFELDKPNNDLSSTMFIPMSYTHEWGHFIGEFITRDNRNWAEFICFVDPDHSSEQDLVKKIHLLKRSLEKIFEGFSTNCIQEQVLFCANSPCLKIDDKGFMEVEETNGNINFVSYNAPLGDLGKRENDFEYSDIPLSFFSRGVSSLRSCL